MSQILLQQAFIALRSAARGDSNDVKAFKSLAGGAMPMAAASAAPKAAAKATPPWQKK